MDKKTLTIALAGNPNVGKSTVFNNLTGLNQHTGNWTGKTVVNARGKAKYENKDYIIMDLPGTYSLMSSGKDEEAARDYICFGQPDVTVVIADATALERNFNLLLQIIEITPKVVLCVSLMDEARKKGISVDILKLKEILGIQVLAVTATHKREVFQILSCAEKALAQTNVKTIKYDFKVENAIKILENDINRLADGALNTRFIALKLLGDENCILKSINNYLKTDITQDKKLAQSLKNAKEYLAQEGLDGDAFIESSVSSIVTESEKIAQKTITFKNAGYNQRDKKIDKILTSRLFGVPIMLALLGLIFFITLSLANYPSEWLSRLFGFLGTKLDLFLRFIKAPFYIRAPIIDGIYKTTAWVIAVMLPPMAIFFPLFTFLEDLGYLPRVAFNLDKPFKKCGCCGKQCLTMCMGFGCNAAGVVGARIIDSPRERLIAILTNNFVPCNGRFPTLIAVAGFFIGGVAANAILGGLVSAGVLTLIVLMGITATLLVSKLLSKTILKGHLSGFSLELPPFRRPQIGKILVRSLLDRTIFVLGRAVIVAVPSGLVIWLLANVSVSGAPLLNYIVNFLHPLARLMGMDGYILTAFILAFPANEIVLPLTIMGYTASGALSEIKSIGELSVLLTQNGWTLTTGVSVLIFTLFHFPCATTCLSIKKETKSVKWTLLAFALPTIIGVFACMAVSGLSCLLGLIF